jgi:hypothetical protein
MQTTQLSIRFYNTGRGVEFSTSFTDIEEYMRALTILISMGLIKQEESGIPPSSVDIPVLVDDEIYAAFARGVAQS